MMRQFSLPQRFSLNFIRLISEVAGNMNVGMACRGIEASAKKLTVAEIEQREEIESRTIYPDLKPL